MKLTLFDIENWREIGATLARNKTRTLMTAFGIFWGTAMLAMLWGGSQGFRGYMSRTFAGLSTNMGVAFPNQRTISYKGFNKGSGWSMTTDDVEAIRITAPAIDKLSGVIQNWSVASHADRSSRGAIVGVDADYRDIAMPVLDKGRYINSSDVAAARKVVVVGRNRAVDLFGAEDPIGQYVSINGVNFLCVGVMSQLGEASVMGRLDDSFHVPSSIARVMYNAGNRIDAILFTSPPGRRPSENRDAMQRVVSRNHSISPADKDAIWFSDISETFEMIEKLFTGISLLALFVGAGTLMSGVIGVGNIMWIVVKERTQEFGIRRAIGAKPIDITVQVLSESILLTLVAGTAGVCFAAIVLGIADKVTFDPVMGNA
ncbi:MAG: ABC transporter permease, partial [Muribaculaceae bacterium]|nr:ABC transporter permease [Muribaculaceae bacterium]